MCGVVRSPTFALVHEYRRLNPRVQHLDLYRLKARDLPQLGLEEILGRPDSVCLVEWPERGQGALPPADLDIALAVEGDGRRCRLVARSPAGRRWLAAIGMA